MSSQRGGEPPPILLVAHEGGRSLTPEQAEDEWTRAMRGIAEACAVGLTGLHPMHPRRHDLLVLTRDAREAARLPAQSRLRSA